MDNFHVGWCCQGAVEEEGNGEKGRATHIGQMKSWAVGLVGEVKYVVEGMGDGIGVWKM